MHIKTVKIDGSSRLDCVTVDLYYNSSKSYSLEEVEESVKRSLTELGLQLEPFELFYD